MFIKRGLSIFYKANSFIQYRRKVRNCYITYSGRYDGAGAQVHAILSIILFAKKFNLEYLHTSISNVEHFTGDRKHWSELWENFFSLGYNEKHLSEVNISDQRCVIANYPPLLVKTSNTIFKVSNCHSFTDLVSEDYHLITEDLKRKYYLTKKEDYYKNKSIINVAIHIRRGDVTASTKRFDRYTSNNEVIKKISLVQSILKKREIEFAITIFSQGAPSEFKEFLQFTPDLILDADEFKTFHSLVTADILIMAKSSFSYVAALLNEGIVFYDPFWHKPLKNWINVTPDIAKIEEELSDRLKRIQQ
jgi:hypothetical protein